MFLIPPPPARSRIIVAAACLLIPLSTARADEPALRELLRDGLYAEEVTRDPEAAAKHYEQVLSRYAEQRGIAAAALFRLAEVRRKQDRKEDAVKLYQQLLAEFPGAANETKLAKENLAALGGKPLETQAAAPTDEEAVELARLKAAATAAPDVLLAPEALDQAASKGWTQVVKFLLAAGSHRYDGEALQNAAQTGNLDIIKLLLADGGPVPEEVATDSIMWAITRKRYTALEFLLKNGVKPGLVNGGYGPLPMLAQTVLAEAGYPAAEVLLKNGADIDEIVVKPLPMDDASGGTALGLAVSLGKFEAANWLLEKGAKADIPDPVIGLTPLHKAALGEHPGTLEIMAKLLAAGADPNHVSAELETKGDYARIIRFKATPLESAIASKSMALEKTKLLLKRGANPNRKDSRVSAMLVLAINYENPNIPELVEALVGAGFSAADPSLLKAAIRRKDLKLAGLLLKHGADPNASGEKYPLLREAAQAGNVELVKMLLEAGADLNFQDIGKTIIRDVATSSNNDWTPGNQDRAVECLKLLVAAGAKLSEASSPDNGFDQMRVGGVRRYLTEQFIIPKLVGGSDITLGTDNWGGLNTMKLATKQEGAEVPGLAGLLWANRQVRIIEPTAKTGGYVWSILRKGEDGKIAAVKFDPLGTAPLPELHWGDLVEMRLAKLEGTSIKFRDGFPPEIAAALRKRISFPITMEIEGKAREIQVRGDRVIFDSTKDEVPLCDAQTLVFLLWPQLNGVWGSTVPTILATRKGWPEVRLASGSKEAGKFQLQAGDRVKLEIPAQVREALANNRRATVALQVPGLPFRRDFGKRINENVPARMANGVAMRENFALLPVTVPTLIQAIVETQVPRPSEVWKSWSGKATLDAANLLSAIHFFNDFTLLPHPDLAHIRIRRLQEDGSETVIDVDLASAISRATAEITPEDARESDVALQGGDVVEIPLKKDAGPWNGFTPAEERFFAKALSGKVQITDDAGNVTFAEIDYRSPRFIATDVGILPMPPASGVPSARGWWITDGGDGTVVRPNVASGGIGAAASVSFLRDGDELRRQPRPRVVPPPNR